MEAELNGKVSNLSVSCALLNVNGDGTIYRWEYELAFGILDIVLRLIGLQFFIVA